MNFIFKSTTKDIYLLQFTSDDCKKQLLHILKILERFKDERRRKGRIEIIVGAQDVVDRVIASLSKISEKLDCCYDSAGPLTIVSIEPLFNAGIDFVKRGGKLRLITEITYANISACREIMKFAEVRHMDGVKGNFGSKVK